MVRSVWPQIAAGLLICCVVSASPLSAQDVQALPSGATTEAPVLASHPPETIRAALATSPQRRPGALVPLYVSFGALQILDAWSTSRAIDRGAVEANPLMKGLAGNSLGMLAVKTAATAGVIYTSEKMWKKNKTAAIMFMIATNSAMTWVVQNNYRAAR